jgi:hypothetical protein
MNVDASVMPLQLSQEKSGEKMRLARSSNDVAEFNVDENDHDNANLHSSSSQAQK